MRSLPFKKGHFGGHRKALLEFLLGKVDRVIVQLDRRERPGPILGSEGFIQRIGALQGNKGLNREIPERRHMAIGVEACIRAAIRR